MFWKRQVMVSLMVSTLMHNSGKVRNMNHRPVRSDFLKPLTIPPRKPTFLLFWLMASS